RTGAGGKHDAFNLGLAGRFKHVERAHDVHFAVEARQFHTARDRAQRGLVEDVITALHAFGDHVVVEDRTFDEGDPAIIDRGLWHEVDGIAATEVIEHAYFGTE